MVGLADVMEAALPWGSTRLSTALTGESHVDLEGLDDVSPGASLRCSQRCPFPLFRGRRQLDKTTGFMGPMYIFFVVVVLHRCANLMCPSCTGF